MSPAPIPSDCDLRDFPYMPVDIVRLFGSAFHARSTDAEWRAGVTLWLKAFHQVPAASMPDDDIELARLAELGRDVRTWRKLRAMALHGWIRADDGRLYHPVVAEKALEAWIEKLGQRKSSGAANAKRHGYAFDGDAVDAQIGTAVGMLSVLNPHSRALRRRTPSASRPAPDGRPSGLPTGSQEKGKGREDSEANASGGKPPDDDGPQWPTDPIERVWTEGLHLMRCMGVGEREARSNIGRWMSETGNRADDVLAAIRRARDMGTRDPIPLVGRTLNPVNGPRHGHRSRQPEPAKADRRVASMARVLGLGDEHELPAEHPGASGADTTPAQGGRRDGGGLRPIPGGGDQARDWRGSHAPPRRLSG